MTHAIFKVWIVPDLSMLVCKNNGEDQFKAFYKQFAKVVLKHDEQVQALQKCVSSLKPYGYICEVSWAISAELKSQIEHEFPWSAMNVKWVRDLNAIFFPWLQHIVPLRISEHIDVQITPDIVPDYVQDTTKWIWHNVLIACVRQSPLHTHIASSQQQQVTYVQVLPGKDMSAVVVELIRRIEEWEQVHERCDPWYREKLPSTGDVPYVPPKKWYPSPDTNFPVKSTNRGAGFEDADGCGWVWDKAEKHWDVQDRRQGYGTYWRITPDGRDLDV